MGMLTNVKKMIKEQNMLDDGDRVVVAVSGGPDSMALLHILRTLQTEYKLELFTAHVNHMFRGAEADADAEFVEEVCHIWNIPCFTAKINVPAIITERGISAQVAARDVRYNFLKHVAAITGSNKIAVGHNADDQAETILMHFLRGTGPEGLTGIPAVRDGIIRPLLNVFRAEIEEYCRKWMIEAREDSSNNKNVYLRNRLRNGLIPCLEREYNNQLRRNLLVLGEILESEEKYWKGIIAREIQQTVFWTDEMPYISIERFGTLAQAVQRRVLRILFQKIGITNAGFIHVEEIRKLLLTGTVGDCIELPGKWRFERQYKHVTLHTEEAAQPCALCSPVLLEVPGIVCLPGVNTVVETAVQPGYGDRQFTAKTGLFDWERLHKPLYIRTRQPGDRFYHTGIGHHKKLKEYFIDEKVPRAQRDHILLVTHGDDILWVVGYYADRRYMADETTKNTLRIEFKGE